MRVDYELGEIAASQAGYIGYEQAINLGLTERAIRWRLEIGVWISIGRGIYKVNGMSGDHRSLLRGATALLPDPTVSHQSAAELHQMPHVPRRLAIVTVHAGTTHDFPGVTIHRSIDLARTHRTEVDGYPTTTPARTLIDLAAVLRPHQMGRVLDEALAARIATIDSVQTVFADVARRGRTGTATMRSLLKDRVGSQLITATRLERVGMKVFEDGGIPRPEFQYPAPWNPNRRIDFAWPRFRVGCECDSRRWHTRTTDFQADRLRDNLALTYNWRIYRFTWEDFRQRPHLVVAQLQAALAV